MKINVYVLHGAWSRCESDGTEVLGISEDIKPLEEKLAEIADNGAVEYFEAYGKTEECRTDRIYEISDEIGEYAKFYITEHELEINSETIGKIEKCLKPFSNV